ncbi:MAG: zf-HC2 domain-containing protein, partial [Planctomycetota bacterium]|nr:zf-HC2 domain-containing protein [Planctomycetota bacterium]
MTANCGQIREILSGAIDDVFLVDGESDLMGKHLADCAECREHQERLRGAVSLLQGLPYLVEAPTSSAPASSFLGKLNLSLVALEGAQGSGDAIEAEADLELAQPSSSSSSRSKKKRSSRGKRSSARRRVPASPGDDPCDDFQELISGSLDDSLLPSESDQLSKHLSLCLACADYQSRLTLQRGTLENFSLIEPNEDFLEWISETLADCAQLERDALTKQAWDGRLSWMQKQTGPLLKLAAAVLLVIGAVAFLQHQLNPPKKSRRVAKDSKPN